MCSSIVFGSFSILSIKRMSNKNSYQTECRFHKRWQIIQLVENIVPSRIDRTALRKAWRIHISNSFRKWPYSGDDRFILYACNYWSHENIDTSCKEGKKTYDCLCVNDLVSLDVHVYRRAYNYRLDFQEAYLYWRAADQRLIQCRLNDHKFAFVLLYSLILFYGGAHFVDNASIFDEVCLNVSFRCRHWTIEIEINLWLNLFGSFELPYFTLCSKLALETQQSIISSKACTTRT